MLRDKSLVTGPPRTNCAEFSPHDQSPLADTLCSRQPGIYPIDSGMYIRQGSLDDILRVVYRRLLKSKKVVCSTRSDNVEQIGALLVLTNPLNRLSRTESRGKIFSALGEWLWYMTGKNSLKFIEYYISAYREESVDRKTVYGGYGPRLFGDGKCWGNQIARATNLISQNGESKRIVIQIFDRHDLDGERRPEIPCTCNIQLLPRAGKLNMYVSMRSNDAYMGLPHDVFCFTMIQEAIAASCGLELGSYHHSVGSLHLYEKHRASADKFIHEGYQESIPMPPMPGHNVWESISQVLTIEREIRKNKAVDTKIARLPAYWADLCLILKIYNHSRKKKGSSLRSTYRSLSHRGYETYVKNRIRSMAPR